MRNEEGEEVEEAEEGEEKEMVVLVGRKLKQPPCDLNRVSLL